MLQYYTPTRSPPGDHQAAQAEPSRSEKVMTVCYSTARRPGVHQESTGRLRQNHLARKKSDDGMLQYCTPTRSPPGAHQAAQAEPSRSVKVMTVCYSTTRRPGVHQETTRRLRQNHPARKSDDGMLQYCTPTRSPPGAHQAAQGNHPARKK